MKSIVNKIILFGFFILTVFACQQNQSDSSKARRFTFAVPSSKVSLSSFKNNASKSLDIDFFKLDNASFLIIDAPSNENFDSMMKTLKKEAPDLYQSIEGITPLERIYKLEQKEIFSANQGQLIQTQENTKRYILTLEMINDPALREDYIKVHGMGMAWPEITNNMKQVGVKDMEIYLEGYQAYLIMDTKADFDFATDGEKWSKLPRESEWQEYVAKFQKVDPQSKATEKWQEMKNVVLGGKLSLFEEDWNSLKNYEIPQWMKEAKFGIFIHWGPNSVAELHTDWYPRWMYFDKGIYNPSGEKVTDTPHPAFAYHKEKFGDQKEFGYKDLIPKFKMENFKAEEWVNLFKKAGAKYVVPVAEHHDGFALYESSITPYHAKAMGPKRDVFKELTDEIKKQGLICGASSHLAFNWNYYNQQDYYDNSDPRFEALYAPRHEHNAPVSSEWIANTWWPRTKEIIDKYQPDIYWFDFYLDREEFAPYHKKLAAYYYNSGIARNKTVVLQTKNLKYESYPEGTHMLDLERSKMDSLRKAYWQTDTSIGKNSWYYAKNWIPKMADELIMDLVDIVSKNGCLLLNIGPKPDGTIPEDQQKTLLDMGKWLDLNGEAIHGATHWKVYGEGPTKTKTGHLSESKNKKFTAQDIRFTTNNGNLYAFVLATPNKDIVIKNLNSTNVKIKSIELLGFDGEIQFKQTAENATIKLPKAKNLEYTWVFKIKSK